MSSERSPVSLVDLAEEFTSAFNAHPLIGRILKEMFHGQSLIHNTLQSSLT